MAWQWKERGEINHRFYLIWLQEEPKDLQEHGGQESVALILTPLLFYEGFDVYQSIEW